MTCLQSYGFQVLRLATLESVFQPMTGRVPQGLLRKLLETDLNQIIKREISMRDGFVESIGDIPL